MFLPSQVYSAASVLPCTALLLTATVTGLTARLLAVVLVAELPQPLSAVAARTARTVVAMGVPRNLILASSRLSVRRCATHAGRSPQTRRPHCSGRSIRGWRSAAEG